MLTFYHVNICRTRAPAVSNVVYANSKKTDIKKQGLESIKNPIIKQNLMGVSSSMEKKGWTDPSGRKGKVRGLWLVEARQEGSCYPILSHPERLSPRLLARFSIRLVC